MLLTLNVVGVKFKIEVVAVTVALNSVNLNFPKHKTGVLRY